MGGHLGGAFSVAVDGQRLMVGITFSRSATLTLICEVLGDAYARELIHIDHLVVL